MRWFATAVMASALAFHWLSYAPLAHAAALEASPDIKEATVETDDEDSDEDSAGEQAESNEDSAGEQAESNEDARKNDPNQSAPAPGETEERDEAFFGADDATTGDDAHTTDRDEGFFGADPSPSEPGLLSEGLALIDRLAEADDPLTIGGRLYMRLDWFTQEDTPAEDFPWITPALLDLYLDARPNDRVRAYARARLSHDFSARADSVDAFGQPRKQTDILLDQLWLKFDIGQWVFLTVGRQPIRWGSGRFWNPTDFLNARFKDPLAILDERNGVSLVKVHLPIESLGWNFYAIADFEGADSPEDLGAAFRAEFLFGSTELAASFAARKDEPYRLGLSISSGVGPFDIWGEVALLHDVDTPRWEGTFDLSALTGELSDLADLVPTSKDESSAWLPRAVAGIETSIAVGDEDALYLGLEYAYNGLGYDDDALYPWLALQGQFVPLYTGRHYGAVYAALPAPGRWDDTSFVLSALGNFSDLSFLTRFDYHIRILTYLDFNAYIAGHFGDNGEFRYSATVPALPDIDLDGDGQGDLDSGFEISAPVVDIGFGLRLQL